MSIQGTTGLPVVNKALEPEWVRRGSASTQKAYETALTFEQSLVEQLSQSLTAASGVGGEGQEGESSEEGGSSGTAAGTGELASMLPQALTGGIMSAGGLGMAAQMTHQLAGAQATAHTRATGGTEAGATGAGAVAPGGVAPDGGVAS
jgi:Rod binding domain-containing protein